MTYNLVFGGYTSNLTYVSFDPSSAKLKVEKQSPVPKNPTWIARSATESKGTSTILYSLSENEGKGIAISLELVGNDLKVTSQGLTHGAPAHGESGSHDTSSYR